MMIKNHIKIAWRNLVRQKFYSVINISGFAVGLAVCMIIMTYVAHELSYDRFHKNAGRIFRPGATVKMGGAIYGFQVMSYMSGPVIKESQPVVEAYMRTFTDAKPVIVSNPLSPANKFSETKLVFADAGFFNFFSFKLLSGRAKNVLDKPFSVVISRDMAKKYFGDESPIGKTINLKIDSLYTYLITGVAENCPTNSSIASNFVASNASLMAMKEAADYAGTQQIGVGYFDVYLLLKHASDSAALRHNLDLMAKKEKTYDNEKFSLTSLPDTHLKNNFGDISNIKYLKIFSLVAILILLLALVNYMSISTARATLRAKEVGVRKVSGASRKSIAAQFYMESALFSILSFVLGYLLCYLITPWFLNILQLRIDNSFLYSPLVLSLLCALLLITVLIAGSYPALVLSAFKPVIILKDKMSKQAGGVTVRKAFTTLQFAISVGLIVCGIVIDRQLYYFRHADTGIDRSNVVMIPAGNSIGKNYPAFERDIQRLAGISGVSTSHYAMFKFFDMVFVNAKAKGESVGVASLVVDSNFIKIAGLQWKYPPTPNADLVSKGKIILNETAIEKLHLQANPIGSYIQAGNQKKEVTGVLKDFNFMSMEAAIMPMALNIVADTSAYFTKQGCNLLAKIKPHTNLPTLLNAVQRIYEKYDRGTPFEYTFMDDAFNAQYKAEDRLASIFMIFTCITLFLAILGLFGLAAFTIEQRTKEIGIRKVLGASVASISTLLSASFLKLVLLSILIASPIAWLAMNNWLQNFAYRITIPWWAFAIAAFSAVFVGVFTVGYHAVKAAIANPVNSLRSE